MTLCLLLCGCFDFERIMAHDGGVEKPDLGVTADLRPAYDGSGELTCGYAGVPSYCTGRELLCDGFETSSPPMTFPVWDQTLVYDFTDNAAPNAGSEVDVSTVRTCEGSQGFHATTVGASQEAALAKNGLTLPGTVYFRAFYYLPSASSDNGGIAFFTLFSDEPTATQRYSEFGYFPDGVTGFNLYSNFTNDTPSFGGTLPLDKWFCMTVRLVLDPVNGSLTLWLDGVQIGNATDFPTSVDEHAFVSLSVGLTAAMESSEMYMDDVALSAEPLGCE